MHKFGKYLAVTIAITMILLANTVNATFHPIPLRETQSTPKFSTDKGSTLHPTQSKSNFHSISEETNNQKSENSFLDFWGFDAFARDRCFNDVEGYRDFACSDEDSMELVIGVNRAHLNIYNNLVNVLSRFGGKIVNTVSIKGEVIALVVDTPLDAVSSFVQEIQMSSLARYVEPNMKFQTQFVPNDPYWSYQWGPQIIDADLAWDTTIGDPSVLVAVIDTGIDYTHPDLADNYVPLGRDWANDDGDPLDDNGHGTHCAGIIAAVLDNNVGIAGLAQVQIMAEKGLDAYGGGWEDDLANAIIDAVDRGADILSNSWGGDFESRLIQDAVQYAFDKGVLVIAAAGNSATEVKHYPAAYDEVVAVTATDPSDYPAWFTTFGEWVEVGAPGVDIYSTLPTYHVTLNDPPYSRSQNYDYLSGTSMACPHAAGVAALIWSQFPNATRDWVRAQLRYMADDLGDPGFDKYYGYGRINARRAVEQAPLDHDLLIFDYKKPRYIQPEEIVSLDVTVLNFGANDEQNVNVQLIVNGSLTDSTSISQLTNGTLATVSLTWNPLLEGTYNVTFYVVPVSGETSTKNNLMTLMVSVKTIIGYVLFDQSHYCYPFSWFSIWIESLIDRGYMVDAYTGYAITPDVLIGYDVFVIPEAWIGYSSDEISTIQEFVLDGGGLLVTGDYDNYIYTSLTSFVGITWGYEMYGWSGNTSDITLHDVTKGVALAYFGVPYSQLFVSSPAISLIRDGGGHNEVMLAVSGMGAGRVIAIADEDTVNDYGIVNADNLVLANNMIDWLLGPKYEHELVVRLDAPSYLEPDKTSILNATVYNNGLDNETNVELQLLINSAVVNSITIPKLVNGTSYTINYSWTPSVEAVYNVTAYAPPVTDESVTLNNIKTKFVSVQYPLINPVEGQYANYILKYYDPSGYLTDTGYWNFTYAQYIEPYKIYIMVLYKEPSGYAGMDWMVVNTMNRLVESGVWAGLWYPGWIETDIDIGSTINLLYGTATVNGSKMIAVGPRAINCWELPYFMPGYPYMFWYDKASGLWIRMETIDPYTGNRMELLLADTNVQIGVQYEHDLGVTLDAPPRLQPGETSVINATVYNLGLKNETNVRFYLFINGTQVASKTLSKLVNGTWYTLNYSWTPTLKGVYNIVAYAIPVTNETVTINNIATKMVLVRRIEVALISDFTELTSVTRILDSMEIGYDVYNNNYMNHYTEQLDLLLKYKAVIFYKGSRWISLAEYATLESYLSSKGNLLVTGFDCLVGDQLLAFLIRSSSIGDNVGEYDLYVVDAAHPIMNGPYGSFPEGYHIYGLFGDCDMAEADTGRDAVTVAELADGYDKIIATEGLPGKVVFWNGVGTYDWSWYNDCQIMFKNLIYWFTVVYQHELTVFVQTPRFLEPGDSTLLNATVRNQGINDETDVELQLLINGTVVKSETIPLLINGTSYTFSYLWTPTVSGTYNVTVYAPPVTGENITRNNVYSRLILVRYAPRILAYIQHTDYYQEYPNTLRAIESTFGPGYILTEMSDYTQLDSLIKGKDILLIPEQEFADFSRLQMIGSAWSTTLSEFLENGGTIILCDFMWGSGGTYGILTGAGLMSISLGNNRTWYTLYVADPTDPLAEGVSSSFLAPDGTISFVTSEENVVVDDGAYPVVIHKEIGRGDIVLLGFDFYSSNTDTKQILGNAVALEAYIMISASQSAGSPGIEVTISGTEATANGTVLIYWDDMLMGNTTANNFGDFEYLLVIPEDATAGVHEIKAVDLTTGKTGSAFFRVIIITLSPNRGPVGTKVTVNGSGFLAESRSTITFNDMIIGYAEVDSFGNFTFTLNTPLSTAETQIIKAWVAEANYAFAEFTVVDVTPLDVKIDVGALYFIGEIAEFYVQTTFKGVAADATITDAVLYKPDGTTESLTAEAITTGLYKIMYTILGDETGTYTLVITASYVTDTIQANGTSFKCFQVSDTLTLMNNQIIEIKDGLATVQTDLGFVKLNLTAMNATLEDIFLRVIAIEGDTATIQTTLGVINATITDIEGNFATIVIPGFDDIETDISGLKATQETSMIAQYVTLIIALIAAVCSTLSLIYVRRGKTKGIG